MIYLLNQWDYHKNLLHKLYNGCKKFLNNEMEEYMTILKI